MARDGSDWDYINEHLGGHDVDGLPNFMNEPGFSDSCEIDIHDDVNHFKTFQEAKNWALESGGAFTRCPSGAGYIPKTHIPAKVDSTFSSDDTNRLLNINLLNTKDAYGRTEAFRNALEVSCRHLSHVSCVYGKSSGRNPFNPNIFDPNIFNNDIQKLTGYQRNKLAEFITEYIRLERLHLWNIEKYAKRINKKIESFFSGGEYAFLDILECSISKIHKFN